MSAIKNASEKTEQEKKGEIALIRCHARRALRGGCEVAKVCENLARMSQKLNKNGGKCGISRNLRA